MLVILALLLSSIANEPANIATADQTATSSAESDHATVDEPQTISIHLPDLPEGAKELEMVLIRPGSFTMGSLGEGQACTERAWPPHEVTITKPYYMGKYEVTQAQWEAVMGSRSHRSKFCGRPNNPVEKVSWRACQKFIKRLNKLCKGTFRLPTEAEWEYACRAGTQTRFSFGDELEFAGDYMWWRENSDPYGTREVGLKRPNPWGLYDMHGNVSEGVRICGKHRMNEGLR